MQWPALEKHLVRNREIEEQLADPAIMANPARYGTLAKEHGTLTKLLKPYHEYETVSAAISQSESLLAAETDPEMRAYAEEELSGLKAKHDQLKTQVEDMLLVDPGRTSTA